MPLTGVLVRPIVTVLSDVTAPIIQTARKEFALARNIQITFARDIDDGPACLEYSYVPEGLRRQIYLDNGQRHITRPDSVPDGYGSNVQVYVLTSNRRYSTGGWQFPQVSRGVLIASAEVVVNQTTMQVIARVIFEDGVVDTYPHPLESRMRECPEP